MKKRLMYNMLIVFLLGTSIDSFAANDGSIPSAQIQGSPIYRFTQWLSKQYDATHADAKFLWEYGTKKVHGKKVKKKETRRAKSISKKIGITLVGIGAIVAAFLGARALLRNGTKKPDHPASSEEEGIPMWDRLEALMRMMREKNIALIDAINKGASHEALLLIEQGAGVNEDVESSRPDIRFMTHSNIRHTTPLTAAAIKGDIDVVRALLDKGANPNKENSHYHTPLMAAALSSGRDQATKIIATNIARLLLDRGADPNQAGYLGYFPLYEAVWTDNKELVELLLRSGADINKKVLGQRTAYGIKRGKTALEKAIFSSPSENRGKESGAGVHRSGRHSPAHQEGKR